jgi:hypothetical protein
MESPQETTCRLFSFGFPLGFPYRFVTAPTSVSASEHAKQTSKISINLLVISQWPMSRTQSGWWFGTLFFHDIWDNPSHWQLTNIFQRGWNHQPAIFAWFHISNYPGDGHKLFPKTGRGQTPGVRGANLRCNSITQCRRVDGVGHGLASIVLGQNIRICWCVK